MKSKLYKTHRNPSYYRLRRVGYFSLSLMIATLLVVVPLTFAQASTSGSHSSLDSSSSQTSGEVSASSDESSSEVAVPLIGQTANEEEGVHHGYHFITKHQNA